MDRNKSNKMKIGTVARVTGGSLVLMAIVAMITVGFFHEALFPQIVNDDVVLRHMESNALLAAAIGWSIICILDFIVTWGVYVILKDKNKTLAALASGLRLIYTLFLGVAVSKLFIHLFEINKRTMSLVDMAQLIERTGTAFNDIWQFGLIIFGVHLVVTGLALLMAAPKMKWLFVILMIGGVGYCVTSGLVLLKLDSTSIYSLISGVMLLPMIVGELGLGIWLLVKGNATFNAA